MIKIVFVMTIAVLLLLFKYLRRKNHSRKKYRLPDELKSRCKKISVAQADIEIMANEYVEEDVDSGYDKVKAIDALYDPNRNYGQVRKFASVMVYYYSTMGKKYRFRSETIELSPDEIQERIQNTGIVDIYFEERNLQRHYFDLSFLAY